MPPRVKVTKEEIVDAAVELIRESGAGALNARTIAVRLQCSTQPVFSNFANMDELRLAVLMRADALCREMIRRETESGLYPPYKSGGMGYIRFAREEKELFKLLYMRDRTNEDMSLDSDLSNEMIAMVRQNTGISEMEARLFHLEMWAFVHGIATMFATGFVDLEWDLVSRMVSDIYLGHRKLYESEE